MIKKEYDELKKKHSKLPSWKEINHEFELSDLDKSDFLTRQIIRRMQEKIETPLKLIEVILQPDIQSFTEMYEISCFTESDKKNILSLYRRIMIIYRNLQEAEVTLDEKKDITIIEETTTEWPRIRKECISYIEKLKSCWTGTTEGKDILEYLG